MTRFRPRLRFSLRTLFVLVTLLGVWLGIQLNWIRERHETRAWLEKEGWRFVAQGDDSRLARGYAADQQAPWSIHLLGEPGVWMVSVPSGTNENGIEFKQRIAIVQELFPEVFK